MQNVAVVKPVEADRAEQSAFGDQLLEVATPTAGTVEERSTLNCHSPAQKQASAKFFYRNDDV